jgi:sterol desaturase/sphingolipid hydroxylase (fatty acid hydroxylase superfamily)
MDHHLTQYPPGKLTSDRYRFPKWYNNGLLLFTPPLLVLMGSAALIVWSLHWPWWMLAVLGTCVATLGFLNDWVHDSFHVRRHPLMHLRTYQKLRRLHFIHHSNMDKNFGIVSFVWDRVFGTLVTEK